MQCKSLWIKASAKCINVNVKMYKRLADVFQMSVLHTFYNRLLIYLTSKMKCPIDVLQRSKHPKKMHLADVNADVK